MGIGERIKYLRSKLNLSQEDFGKQINLTKFAISNYENGRTGIPDRVIADICREYSVNELWLRTGQGDPKNTLEGEERFALNIGKLQNTDNETVMRWVNAIAETNPELLEDIEKFFMVLLGIKKEPD